MRSGPLLGTEGEEWTNLPPIMTNTSGLGGQGDLLARALELEEFVAGQLVETCTFLLPCDGRLVRTLPHHEGGSGASDNDLVGAIAGAVEVSTPLFRSSCLDAAPFGVCLELLGLVKLGDCAPGRLREPRRAWLPNGALKIMRVDQPVCLRPRATHNACLCICVLSLPLPRLKLPVAPRVCFPPLLSSPNPFPARLLR
jgi:hypothetical protein